MAIAAQKPRHFNKRLQKRGLASQKTNPCLKATPKDVMKLR